MNDTVLHEMVNVLVNQGLDACSARHCDSDGRGWLGKHRRPSRCVDCPLDRLDRLWSAYFNGDPDPEIDT